MVSSASPQSFETWYAWFYAHEYARCHQQVGTRYPLDAHEIDSLLNTAAMQVYQHWGRLTAVPLAYFRTVLKHAIWRYLRHRRAAQQQREAYAHHQRHTARLMACTHAAVADILAQLPARERRLVTWYLAGYPDIQVAAWVGTSAEAVRQARATAYRRVRGRLGRPGGVA